MGAVIDGIGTSRLTIEGVRVLHPVSYEVIPDRIEAATYLAAVGVCGGELRLTGARSDHMEMLLRKLEEMGMEWQEDEHGLTARVLERLQSVDVSTLPYPGLASDYKHLFVAAHCVSQGEGIVP